MRMLKVTLFLVLCNLIICGFIIASSEDTEKMYRVLRQYHSNTIDSYYKIRESWLTSNLGSILFKNKNEEEYGTRNKTFLVMTWTPWHGVLFKYHHELDDCRVNNCKFTSRIEDMNVADAVVFWTQKGLTIPYRTQKRPQGQRWIYFNNESPVNLFTDVKPKPNIKEWANIFNWTMTYRSDSDIPAPYGRTVPLKIPLSPQNMSESLKSVIPNWDIKQKDVYLVAMITHCCVKERMNYIRELKKYLTVDVYGKCSADSAFQYSCPGHTSKDCPLINKYFFYLAFENSKCRQYITEKTFYNSYTKGSIPIIMGAPKLDCEKLLPPLSFLHVNDFSSPKSLADEVKRLASNESDLLKYHQWRRVFKVTNEHSSFETEFDTFCRICQALNYNDERPKTYDEYDLKIFTEADLLCKRPFTRYRPDCTDRV